VELRRLWLTDFRNYNEAEVSFAPGLTVLLGANGQGKTNIVEAIAYLATLNSMRGAPTEALVRRGAATAVVRAEGSRDGRDLLIEAEIVPGGRSRVQVNRQRLVRSRDLLGALRVTVFAPDDLSLVKGGPVERRRYLDELLVAANPRHDALRTDLDRILRQRNTLLKQSAGKRSSGGRLSPEIETTLDVWDTRLVEVGEALVDARLALLDDLVRALDEAYRTVAGRRVARPVDTGVAAHVTAVYQAPWRTTGLAQALIEARSDELRRGVSLVGPHRDDLAIELGGLPSRTHVSQGEQRTLALALRLAGHQVVTEAVGTPPVLLLDDVFSELDDERADALLASLPRGQTVLTSASGLPPRARPDRVMHVVDGRVEASPPA
jgi:DNA replication and repair protein RecF